MRKSAVVFALWFLSLFCSSALAQSTEFSYQGQMQNASSAANGVFDFEFALFGSALGGSQLGPTQTRGGVNVANGIFSVSLDFGNQFDGTARFLEIRVRQSGGGTFTTLSPRQSISNTPYAVRSLEAQNAVNAQIAANATNALNATNAVSAVTANNFTGTLAGDVTGSQGSTTVARLRGTNVASTPPTNGQVLKFNSGANQWQPAPDDTGTGGGGTITGVTAGTGLTGGGTTGSVTVAISNAGVTNAQLADGSVTTAKIADASITDAKITSVSGAKVTGAVAASTNSNQLGGIAANQFVQTSDPRLSDSRSPTAGSSNYIQNGTSAQSASNFNISGNGTAGGILTAASITAISQFNVGIGANRILSAPGVLNTFTGINAGTANSTGNSNAFFGSSSGASNTTGTTNSFFGVFSGQQTVGGSRNSYFGYQTGQSIAEGVDNSFFGYQAGRSAGNSSASRNTFVGAYSGTATVAPSNSFYGYQSGLSNVSGLGNTFIGTSAGESNTNANFNTFVGANAGNGNTTGERNVFVGNVAGFYTMSGGQNVFVGDTSGLNNTTGGDNTIIGADAGQTLTTGSNNTLIGNNANVASGNLDHATAIGADAVVALSNTIALGRSNGSDRVFIWGLLDLNTLDVAGSQAVCRNASGRLSTCSSSLRYKTNINRFGLGLDLIRQLKPITFDWKEGGMHDLGLGAEDVAAIEPLLVTYNREGQVEGVKYDRVGVVLINAVREQQKMIESQQREISELKALVCAVNKKAGICKK